MALAGLGWNPQAQTWSLHWASLGTISWRWRGLKVQAQLCKRQSETATFHNSAYNTACANIPLAKESHIAKRGAGDQGGGRRKEEEKLQSYRAKSVDSGYREFREAINGGH